MSLSPDQKLAAYFLGRRIAGQRRKQDRVPVAYLYNGVRLPGLPEEWNPETHPFAFVVITNNILTGNKERATLYVAPSTTPGMTNIGIGNNSMYTYVDVDDISSGWSEFTVMPDGNRIVMQNIKWTNFDIYTSDGTLVMGASDPVPVYE